MATWLGTASLIIATAPTVAQADESKPPQPPGLAKKHQAGVTIPDLAPHPTLDKKLAPGASDSGSAGPTSAQSKNTKNSTTSTSASSSTSKTDQSSTAKRHSAENAGIANARKTGKPTPVPELTTTISTTTANPDGTLTASVNPAPVRTNINGSWQPIDTTLVKTVDGVWSPKAALTTIAVSGGGSGPLAIVGPAGARVTITWPLGPLPTPLIDSDAATYPQVLPGVDLRVSASSDGVHEVLIVTDAQAASNPSLRTLHFGITGDGLTVKAASDGGLSAIDSHGRQVFGGSTPEMWDSSGTDTNADVVAAAGTTSGSKAAVSPSTVADTHLHGAKIAAMPLQLSGGTATLIPDQGLLTSATTKWPVYIDPTLAAGHAECLELYQGAPSTWDSCGSATDGTLGNLNVMRAGDDTAAGSVGAVRSMFSFDIAGALTYLNPYTNIPGASVNDDPATGIDNITKATLTLTAHNSPNCNTNAFWIYDTGPIVNRSTASWTNYVANQSGPWGQQAVLLNQTGAIGTNGCGDGASLSINDTQQVQTVFANNIYNNGYPTVTLGVRMDQESTSGDYWSFYYTQPANPVESATLNVQYRPSPYIAEGSLSTTPPMTFHGPVSGNHPNCQDEGNGASTAPALPSYPGPPPTIGYIGKNFNNQIVLHANIGDADPVTASAQFQFGDVTNLAPNNTLPSYTQILPSSGFYHVNAGGPVGTTDPSQIILGPMTSDAIPQNNTANPLIDGHTYRYSAYVYDPADSPISETNETCYFVVAFNAPKAPYVINGGAPDFPQLGNPSAANMYATKPSSNGITIQADTAGVNIDHFEYVINDDSSQIHSVASGSTCNNPSNNSSNALNSGCVTATSIGSGTAGISAKATIPVPAGVTTMGTNTVWIRAVDYAGNVSPVGSYQFYLPGKPNAVPTLGDITGDGVPDILAVEPDPVSGARLMTFPGNTDPNLLGNNINNAVEAAPATAAPDGSSWANTLISHRGALRGVAVDDLFAYSKTNKALYYYLNSDIFGGVVQKDMYAINHKVVITRPICNPLPVNGWCAGGSYAPDWSKVTQILAFGNAAGNKPGSFAGRTNLITVEDNGNHGANVWMFSPGPGLGQLANPVLLSSASTNTNGNYNSGNQLSWLSADLIAPGINPGGTLPNLWARDRLTGNLWQFTNTYNSNNIEDPTSLGNLGNATTIGTKGGYGIGTYANLFTAGNPNIANGSGALSQNGYPALWDVESSGALKMLPGSPTGPMTPVNQTWPTTRSSWTNVNTISSVDGSPITLPAGPILLGEGQTAGNPQLCMDLQSNNDNPNVPVWTYGCNGQGGQDWIVNSDGTIRYGSDQSKCLEIAMSVPQYPVLTPFKSAAGNYGDNAGTMLGAPVQINTCTQANGLPAANQQWILRPSAAALNAGQHGWYDIYNPNSARCLDNGWGNTSPQQQLWIYDCLDSQGEQFQAPAALGTWMNVSAGALAPWAPTATAPTSISGDTYALNGTNGSSYGLVWYVPYEADYYIESSVNTGPGNGIMQANIDDGPNLPFPVDTYAPTAGTASAYYGTQHLTVGYHKFMFTVTGKNAASSGYQLSLTHLSIAPSFGVGPTSNLQVTTPMTPQLIAPATVSFDASKTFPGGAAITSYTFDFGDGTPTASGTATTTSHTYTQSGTYTAKITVTDSHNVSSTATQVVSIAPPAPTTLTSGDGTTTAACVSTASSAPTMASLTPTLSAAVGPGLTAQFELRDITDPSITPPVAVGGAGSTGSADPTSTLATPSLINGHEYGFAARSTDATGNVSPISPTCYFWALTSGSQASPTGAIGLAFDNTFYSASSNQTWTGPLTHVTFQNDGALVLSRNSDNAALWTSGTGGNPGAVLALQYDGNMVIYTSTPTVYANGTVHGTLLWNTGTGSGTTHAILQADGHFAIYAGTTQQWTAEPVGHWTLGDGTGTTAADTGYPGAHPAALTGGASLNPGKYATFDGSTGYAATTAAAIDTTRPFTISAWAKLANLNGYQTIVTQQGNQVGGFHLEFENNGASGNNWAFVRATSDATNPAFVRVNSPAGLPQAGVWTHLIGSWDPSNDTMSLYVNGQLVGSATDTTPIPSSGPLVIGRGYASGTANNFVNGYIADVRTYQQAFSINQASWLYQNSGFAGAGYVNPPSTTNPPYTFAGTTDWNGDGKPDLIARDNATCNLYVYLGQGTTSEIPSTRTLIGTQWCGMTFAGLADWQHTGLPGILARENATGNLWFYPNTGPRIQVGTQWNTYAFAGVADWNHDGHYDILAREDSTGILWDYPGDATGGTAPSRIQISTGWTGFTFAGIADGNNDGHWDIIACEQATGILWFFPGDATGGSGSRIQLGTGWGSMTFAGVVDWDKDGSTDILARNPNATLLAYNHNATPGATDNVVQIGTGW